jgi:hypothetical protein
MTARNARFLIAAAFLLGVPSVTFAQWITFTDQTSTYLSMANYQNDIEEKDLQLADLDNDGDLDLVNVRKQEFYLTGNRTHVLLMNVAGVLTDQTATYAPGFLANPSLARVVVIGDYNGDGWKDVVVVNTDFQPVHYYHNAGQSGGSWLGLVFQTGHFPTFTPGGRFCSAAAGDPDGDGDLDMFLGDYNNTLENQFCTNNGLSTFANATAAWFPSGNNNSTFSVEASFADADTDGDQDIYESDGTVGQMKIHVNRRIHVPGGAGQVGNFFVTQNVASSATYTSAIGDLNNDGKIDIYQGRDGQDAYSINTSTPSSISFTTTTLSNAPKTGNFAGNAYIVDMDGDGDNDIAMADTDVDVAGCNRNAVLYRNGHIGAAQPQLLVDPWYTAGPPQVNTFTNIHTQGTHDLAILDLNGDGLMDIFNARCQGYHVFIQDGPPFNLSVTSPAPGAISINVNGAVPNTTLYTLVSFVQLNPVGSGSFFGLDPSAFINYINLSPMGQPIIAPANGAGAYSFSLPGGSVPSPLPTQWRTAELTGPQGYTLTNIVTLTF